MVLSRVWPPHRGRPQAIDVPAIHDVTDLVAVQRAVTDAVLGGAISALDGARIASVLEAQRRMIETMHHERLLRELEKARPASAAPPQW